MKISAKIDYACRALIELSLLWPNNAPVQIQAIAKRQNIPIKFLTQIMIILKQCGYVDSLRGKNGGYLLTQAPKEIKLSEVIHRLGGLGLSQGKNHAGNNHDILDAIWQDINDVVFQKLDSFDFEKICDRIHRQNQTLMFDI